MRNDEPPQRELLIIVTLNRKIPYHRWITTHRFMGLFFIIVSVHVFLVLYDGEELALLSPPGVALAVLLLAGLAAYGYKQLLYPKKEKHPFTLTAVNRLERATEVVLKPRGGMFPFEPGQFAFITIDAAGFREAHPFTISSGATEDGLRFTMKVLGDYTRRVRDELAAGADAGAGRVLRLIDGQVVALPACAPGSIRVRGDRPAAPEYHCATL